MKSLLADALKQTNTCPPAPKNNSKDNNNSSQPRRSNRIRRKAQALLDGLPVTYCWTHGVTTNLGHDSKTCTNRAAGHKEDDTYENRMGGSDNRVKARRT